MSRNGPSTLRIGDVARMVGTTARTIRYYEEIGLLAQATERPPGGHRLYSDADVAHLREVVRLRDLLGLSLEELKSLVEAEEARAQLRSRLRQGGIDEAERRDLLEQALGHLDLQLDLVRRRTGELARLEEDLVERHAKVTRLLRESGQGAGAEASAVSAPVTPSPTASRARGNKTPRPAAAGSTRAAAPAPAS